MAISLWELQSKLSLKDVATSTEGFTRSIVNCLCKRKSKYLHKNTFVDSFFLLLLLLALLFSFLYSKLFQNNYIDALWNQWLPLQQFFCWNTTEKGKLKKCFFWVPGFGHSNWYRSCSLKKANSVTFPNLLKINYCG